VISFDIPATYDFKRNGETTVAFSGQTARIEMATELISAMMDFNKTDAELQEMYTNRTIAGADANPFQSPALNSSSNSVQSKVAASIDFFSANTAEAFVIKSDFSKWITAQVDEVFPNQMVAASRGVAGQIADGTNVRYVNAKGLEYDQAVNKGLIGALMVDQMLNHYLSPAILDEADNRLKNDAGILVDGKNYTTMEHKWDEAYGYLFGKSANPTEPLLSLGDDSFLNKYLARVNNESHFNTVAQDIFDAFKLGRAAIVNGDYRVRDEQAEVIKELIAKVIAIRAVYYLQVGKETLPTSGNDYGPAFHDLSEGFGFIYSLRFLRQSNSMDPYFTRSEVDELLDQMTAGDGFWSVTSGTLDSMAQSIADKFNFTVAQAIQ